MSRFLAVSFDFLNVTHLYAFVYDHSQQIKFEGAWMSQFFRTCFLNVNNLHALVYNHSQHIKFEGAWML